MKLTTIVIFLALGLVGCKAFGPAQVELLGCNAYTVAIAKANDNFDKLSLTQAKIINTAKVGLDAICLGDAPDVADDAKAISVDAGVKLINSIIIPLIGG